MEETDKLFKHESNIEYKDKIAKESNKTFIPTK